MYEMEGEKMQINVSKCPLFKYIYCESKLHIC